MDHIQKMEMERLRLDQIALDYPELTAIFRRNRRIMLIVELIAMCLIGYGGWLMWQWVSAVPVEDSAPLMAGVAIFALLLHVVVPKIALKVAGISE